MLLHSHLILKPETCLWGKATVIVRKNVFIICITRS